MVRKLMLLAAIVVLGRHLHASLMRAQEASAEADRQSADVLNPVLPAELAAQLRASGLARA